MMKHRLNIVIFILVLISSVFSQPEPIAEPEKVALSDLKTKISNGPKWKLVENDFKMVNISDIMDLDLKDLYLARIVARLAKDWSFDDRKKLLMKVSDLGDEELIEYFGKRVKVEEISTLSDFQALKKYIYLMPTKVLQSAQDENIKSTIWQSLITSRNKKNRVNINALIKSNFGEPSKWTADNFNTIVYFLDKIPPFKLRELNSTVTKMVSNQLNSIYITVFKQAIPQANQFMLLVMENLNISDPSQTKIFKDESKIRESIMSLEGLPESIKNYIKKENLAPNLRKSFMENRMMIKSQLGYMNRSLESPEVVGLGDALYSIPARNLKNVDITANAIEGSTFDQSLIGKQMLEYLLQQIDKLYPNKGDTLDKVPATLFNQVWKQDEIEKVSSDLAKSVISTLLNNKNDFDVGKMMALIKKIGGPKGLVAPEVTEVGSLASVISINEAEKMSSNELIALLVTKKGKNPLLEKYLTMKELENQKISDDNFSLKNYRFLRSLSQKSWINISVEQFENYFRSNELKNAFNSLVKPSVVKNLAMGFNKLTKAILSSQNMSETPENMVSIHPDLSFYPIAIVAEVLDLQEIIRQGKCAELLQNLPTRIQGLFNFLSAKRRNEFGKFVSNCLKEHNRVEIYNLLSSAMLLDTNFVTSILPESLLVSWLDKMDLGIMCIGEEIGQKIARRLKEKIHPRFIGAYTYKRLYPIIHYFPNSFIENIPNSIMIDFEMRKNREENLKLSSKNPEIEDEQALMDTMCRHYLAGQDENYEIDARYNFFRILKSKARMEAKMLKHYKGERQNPAKREVEEDLNCDAIIMSGRARIAISLLDLNKIDKMELLNCFDYFGEMRKYDPVRRFLIKRNTLEGLNGLGNATTSDLRSMGYLLAQMTEAEVNESLKIDSWEKVRIFGRISNLMNDPLKEEIVANIKSNLKMNLEEYTKEEVANLGSLLGSFPLEELNNLTKDFMKNNEFVISRLMGCSKDSMMIFGEQAIKVYGDPATWDAITVARVGSLAGGLEPTEFRKLKPEAFEGFTPFAANSMYDGTLMVLTKEQLKMMPLETTMSFDDSDVKKFSKDVKDTYEESLNIEKGDKGKSFSTQMRASSLVMILLVCPLVKELV